MYSDESYEAAFSELIECVEESTLRRDDFTLALVAEGRRREIFRAWIKAMPESERGDVFDECVDDIDWLLKDPAGIIADRFHDHLSAELERRLIVRHAFEAENQRALAADRENDRRWMA